MKVTMKEIDQLNNFGLILAILVKSTNINIMVGKLERYKSCQNMAEWILAVDKKERYMAEVESHQLSSFVSQ